MADYSLEVDIDVRFSDIDSMGHVNNAVYATYLEEARVAYFEEVLSESLSAVDSVLAHLELDYRKPVRHHDDVTVALRVPELGESSVPMEYEVRANGEVAATGETIQVAFDRETESSIPIPEPWREQIRTFEGL